MTKNPLLADPKETGWFGNGATGIPRSGGASYADDLAAEYNRRLSERDPRRADEIEWYVDHAGDVKPRFRPEFTGQLTRRMADKHEYERQQWKRRNREGEFSDPHQARNAEMDF